MNIYVQKYLLCLQTIKNKIKKNVTVKKIITFNLFK